MFVRIIYRGVTFLALCPDPPIQEGKGGVQEDLMTRLVALRMFWGIVAFHTFWISLKTD